MFNKIIILLIIQFFLLNNSFSINSNLLEKANTYFDLNKHDSAIIYYDQVLAELDQIDKKYIEILYKEGLSYFKIGNYEEAVIIFEQVNSFYDNEDVSNPNFPKLTRELSYSYAVLENYVESQKYAVKSFELSKLTNDADLLGAYYQLGSFYFFIEDFDEALKYYNNGLDLAIEKDVNEKIPNFYAGLGIVYSSLDSSELGLFYNRKFLNFLLESENFVDSNTNNIASTLLNIGNNYIMLKEVDSAFFYLNKSIEISIKIKNHHLQSNSLKSLGSFYSDLLNDNELALYQYNYAYNLMIQECLFEEAILTLKNIIEVNAIENDFENAYLNSKRKDSIQLLIDAEVSNVQINKLKIQFNTQQKEDEIIILEKNKQISNLYIGFLVSIISVLILGVLFLVNRYFLGRRINKLLYEKNELISLNNSKLKDSNIQLERFANIASHDIRQPLRMIGGYIDILKFKNKDKLDEESLSYIQIASESVIQMDQILQDILAYSKLDVNIEKKLVNMNELIAFVLNTFDSNLKEKKGEISVDFLPNILANKSSILQLFINLIGNAIKYQKAPPKVVIKYEDRGGFHYFEVIDNGIGIHQDRISTLFEMFTRAHQKEGFDGNGIGLAVCKRVVEIHGGEINIESEVNVGTKIYFTLSKI